MIIQSKMTNSSYKAIGCENKAFAPCPDVEIIWHKTAQDIIHAHWKPMADDCGMSVDEFLRESDIGGVDEDGNEIWFSDDDMLDSIESMGLWGFASTKEKKIHLWASSESSKREIAELVGHELGHLTGNPSESSMEEEMRADQYASVAIMVYDVLESMPNR